MPTKDYLLSLPERLIRSVLGLGAGVAREVGEIALPTGVRRSQLYQNLVDATLRYVIEQVGGVDGVYSRETQSPDDFLARRTAGNAIELLGIVAFSASPVWILAALADLSGVGRHLIPEIADALKEHGLLDKDAQFSSVDQMLDGLERTSSQLALTINTPPLDVAGLRTEWKAIREHARGLPPADLPSRDTIRNVWAQLKNESERQNRSIFQTSSVIAVSAVRVGAKRTGQVLGAALLDYYQQTLRDIRQVGYAAYARRQLHPYIRACARQFSPKQRTVTQALYERLRANKAERRNESERDR